LWPKILGITFFRANFYSFKLGIDTECLATTITIEKFDLGDSAYKFTDFVQIDDIKLDGSGRQFDLPKTTDGNTKIYNGYQANHRGIGRGLKI